MKEVPCGVQKVAESAGNLRMGSFGRVLGSCIFMQREGSDELVAREI